MKSSISAAKTLLQSHDIDLWNENLAKYPEAVKVVSIMKKKSDLIDLDKWLWKDYPDSVRNRSPESISKDELTRIMTWKLCRGKNRPTLLNLIRQNDESSVTSVSIQALRSLHRGEWHEALEILTELRGVGPGIPKIWFYIYLLQPLPQLSYLPLHPKSFRLWLMKSWSLVFKTLEIII